MIGDKIRELRLQRGITPEQLAEEIGVSSMAIEFYEANSWRPGLPVIEKLAAFFGVSLPEMIGSCSLLYDDITHETLIVRDVGSHKVEVVGVVKNACGNTGPKGS
jgi:transcriptional regulator with XRE-family HTH domain